MLAVKSEVFSAILDDAILKSLGTKFAATSAIFALSTKSMLVALEVLSAHFLKTALFSLGVSEKAH